MNVTSFITKYYENKWQRKVRKNKANSNPIKANTKPIKANTKPIKANTMPKQSQNKAKTNPISEKPKMNVNLYVIEDYENETTLRPQQNKPNQSQSNSKRIYP